MSGLLEMMMELLKVLITSKMLVIAKIEQNSYLLFCYSLFFFILLIVYSLGFEAVGNKSSL